MSNKSIIHAKLWHNLLNNKEFSSGVWVEKKSITPTGVRIYRIITSPKSSLISLATSHLFSQGKIIDYVPAALKNIHPAAYENIGHIHLLQTSHVNALIKLKTITLLFSLH